MLACNQLSILIGLDSYGPLVTQNFFYLYLHRVHCLDYIILSTKKQFSVPYKGHKKICRCKTSPVYLYCHLFLAWLTRTPRSNVLSGSTCRDDSEPCKQTRSCCPLLVEVSQTLFLLSDKQCKPPERTAASAEAARADSTLCSKDRSLFTTGCDTFTKCSEIHFSHFGSYTCSI